MFVVIIGNLLFGVQSVHGPFKKAEHANRWAKVYYSDKTHILAQVMPVESDLVGSGKEMEK